MALFEGDDELGAEGDLGAGGNGGQANGDGDGEVR